MKFTNGFWMLRDEYQAVYAVEYWNHEIQDDNLTVYTSSTNYRGRGDVLNIGMLTVTLSSPMDDVIHVEITHFDGASKKEIRPVVYPSKGKITITEDENNIIYTAGSLSAVISKAPGSWSIKYMRDGKMLTQTDFRNMARMQDRNTKESYMVEQLSLGIGEYVYGLGERFTPFVKNGQVVETWNEDGGTASEQGYKDIPFYITSGGYGVLVDSMSDVQFEIASEKVEEVQFSVKGETLGYYMIAGGSPKGTVSRYCQLTGMPALPPAWSFGLWLTTSFTTNYDEDTTTSFIQGMADRDIPLHVFHFDCYWMRAYRWCDFIWDPATFPDPEGLLKRYHERGLKICVWINPYIGQMSYLYKEGKELGYLVKKIDGSIWQTDLWQAGMALVDFTNPDAAAWYAGKLKQLMDMGVDCFKTDFGERIPVKDIAWFNGADPVDMHNAYTYYYNKTVFDLLEKERGRGEAIVFARSAAAGGQQFPAHWGGDCSATYASMAETLRGGLSLASCGFSFWSHDISGFEQTAPADIYKRWCQFGLLSSHSRLHGSSSYRVPWLFDDEACVVLKEMVELKCRLMPYLYEKAVESHTTGVPMMRPMFMEFPSDRSALTLDLQYMMGDALLVAPVFREDGEAEYYLPAGKWVDMFTGELVDGGCWKKQVYDYHSLPLMVAPEKIIALGSCCTKPDYDFADGVNLAVSYLPDGACAETSVPDLKGDTVLKAYARREGNKILVEADQDTNWTCSILWKQEYTVERNGKTAVITLA